MAACRSRMPTWVSLAVLVAIMVVQMMDAANAFDVKPGKNFKPKVSGGSDLKKKVLPPGWGKKLDNSKEKKPLVLPPGLKQKVDPLKKKVVPLKKPTPKPVVLPPAPAPVSKKNPAVLPPGLKKKPVLPPGLKKKPVLPPGLKKPVKPQEKLKTKPQLPKPITKHAPPPAVAPKKSLGLPKKKNLLPPARAPVSAPAAPHHGSPPKYSGKGSGGGTTTSSTDLNKLPGLPNLPPNLPFNPLAPFQGGPWLNDAHATFYGDETGAETMGGACGYGDLFAQGYGLQTAALSEVMFNNGYGCGECYEIKCADSKWCNLGQSITVTATNLCPADWSKPSDNGGWCNPPRNHFDLSKVAFLQIAQEVAGIVPVAYRRVPCIKLGGIKFTIFGNQWWHLVHITNVAGAGDIDTVSIKGSNTDWFDMTRNWGATYQCFQSLVGQSLSFKITSRSGQVVTSLDVAPSTWQFGVTYVGNQFP